MKQNIVDVFISFFNVWYKIIGNLLFFPIRKVCFSKMILTEIWPFKFESVREYSINVLSVRNSKQHDTD